MTVRAIYEGVVIAESSNTIELEGNHYFPAESLQRQYFSPSSERSHCHWKGEAHYYTITVGEKRNEAAAWYYPTASKQAQQIEGAVAFWRGVRVEVVPE